MAFEEHINSACRVLKHSFKTVPGLFTGKEICIMDYLSQKLNDKVIEVRFDTATLTCLFDKNDICDGAFLFLDDLNDLQHYIDYCNKKYPYNFILCGWIIEDCCFQIKPCKHDYYFALLPATSN